MTLSGTFETPNASRYLQQLCKHFGHKIEVSFTPEKGVIHFEFGDVDLVAGEAVLTVSASPADDETATRIKGVVDSHLKRFAFRENFEAMVWSA